MNVHDAAVIMRLECKYISYLAGGKSIVWLGPSRLASRCSQTAAHANEPLRKIYYASGRGSAIVRNTYVMLGASVRISNCFKPDVHTYTDTGRLHTYVAGKCGSRSFRWGCRSLRRCRFGVQPAEKFFGVYNGRLFCFCFGFGFGMWTNVRSGKRGWGLAKRKLQYAGVVCQASEESTTTNVAAEKECDWGQQQHGIAI